MITAVLIILGIAVLIGYLRDEWMKSETAGLRKRIADLEMQIRSLDPGLPLTEWQELADKEPGQ